ncbi:acylneuraminate cytidylyltransferase [Bacillus xiamenensis]|uniref:Acylneuraminate cytidylyltransferase n=1 Tax=Bacillus xiamenensis TaxID=1178537 RepID=A0AAC9NE49_9BACI|nr:MULTISPECIES: N-acylneuraminate cytidylyltransferase [Bacillus]AOZ90339.1 acylneuraminate cytidylyltransferase [Bacillus xiamenensis]EKF35617.1 N-acylneuraminate cytidylyltransferase [Bacillus xiamenensis]MBG9911202.1 acylneuraminate cytidylyltransferase [Bacillus xiamenensis]MCW1836066.1 acylneuraminate cytidylyltransferase [Bacillus xiamenensis]MCY9577660.1 acylneuraminate cytidylyltransferase [Bacillus xiamenensis]
MYRGNRILAMIPAFSGQQTHHSKHIRVVAERPLIYWTIQPLLQMVELDEVIVSSEDVNTQIISSHYGANVIELPSTHVTEQTPAILAVKHALAYLEREGKTFDIVLYLPPLSPLRQPEDIENCLKLLVEGGFDCTASFTEALENPNETWTLHETNEANLYKDNHYFFIPTHDHPYTYGRLNGAVYAFHVPYAKECIHSFLEGSVGAYMMDREQSLVVLNEADRKKAESVLLARQDAEGTV